MVAPTPAYFRILSFDGGPSGLAQLHMLHRMVSSDPAHRDLLARVDLCAGTSFGSLIALYLAARTKEELAHGPRLLEDLIGRATKLFNAYGAGNIGLARMLTSLPATSRWRLNGVRRAIRKHLDFTDDLVLEDLPGRVCVVSFDLRTRGRNLLGEAARPYGPKVFTNLERTTAEGDEPDMRLSVMTVALRSGSMPVLLPIIDGHADGALFGNNPTMCAVSSVLAQSREVRTGRAWDIDGLACALVDGPEQILCLSLGGDDQRLAGLVEDIQLRRSQARWGAWSWLLNPFEPMLLVRLLIASDGRGVDFQARSVLGPARICRVCPPTVGGDLGSAFFQALYAAGDAASGSGKASAEAWAGQDPEANWLQLVGLLLVGPATLRMALMLQLELVRSGAKAAVQAPGLVIDLLREDWPDDVDERLDRAEAMLARHEAFAEAYSSGSDMALAPVENAFFVQERIFGLNATREARSKAHETHLGVQKKQEETIRNVMGRWPRVATLLAAAVGTARPGPEPELRIHRGPPQSWNPKTLAEAQRFLDTIWCAPDDEVADYLRQVDADPKHNTGWRQLGR